MNLDLRNNEGQLSTTFCSPRLQKGPTSPVRATICLGVSVCKGSTLVPQICAHFSAFKLDLGAAGHGSVLVLRGPDSGPRLLLFWRPTEPWHRAPGYTSLLPAEGISHGAGSQVAAGCIRIAGHSLPVGYG